MRKERFCSLFFILFNEKLFFIVFFSLNGVYFLLDYERRCGLVVLVGVVIYFFSVYMCVVVSVDWFNMMGEGNLGRKLFLMLDFM